MRKSYVHLSYAEFGRQYSRFFQHQKKVKALENISQVSEIPSNYKRFLHMIKSCLEDGFLEQAEETFLDHMLNKLEENYFIWSHNTKWVRSQIQKYQDEKQSKRRTSPTQFYFDFDKKGTRKTPDVPIEVLIANQNSRQYSRSM